MAVWWNAVAAAAAAFIVVSGVTPWVERWASERGLVDQPGGRHLHSRAVPRVGGVAIVAGLVVGGVVLWASGVDPGPLARVGAGLLVVFAVGLVDDLREISPRAKLLGQTAAALVSMALGLRIEFVSLPAFLRWEEPLIYLGAWSWPLTALWLVGVTNAINLLDGLDGLAAGVVAIASVSTALAAAMVGGWAGAGMLMVLGAGCLGFLRYNSSPARIFMGDSGALALGFAFAAASALGTAKGHAVMAILVPVMSLGIPLIDTAWAIVRRGLSRRSMAQADNGHIHYRLLARWRAPRLVALALYGASAALGALGLFLSPRGQVFVVPSLALMGVAVLIWIRAIWGWSTWVRAGRKEAPDGHSGRAGLRHPTRGHQAGPRYQGS